MPPRTFAAAPVGTGRPCLVQAGLFSLMLPVFAATATVAQDAGYPSLQPLEELLAQQGDRALQAEDASALAARAAALARRAAALRTASPIDAETRERFATLRARHASD